ncbi:MAG: VWA domain-containing protein, partial [Chitinispirillaceae bacterium]|nr:VWA domain-containing protein [Chitinispirillaceae bacterium]
MKAQDFSGKKAMCMTFILLFFAFSSLSAKEVGRFSYRSAPENLDGDTILVNDTMVAMSEKIRVFQELIIDRPDTIPEMPAVFFLIDNSGSMNLMNIDPMGNRFTVTSALIDTIMAKHPQAEVGVAVFNGGLYYNPASKPGIFQTITSNSSMGLDDTGAFVPLLPLNQTYGTQTGYEVLKEVLAIDTSFDTVRLRFPSIGGSVQTNIN